MLNRKPVWWKIILGGLLALSQVGAMLGPPRNLAGNRDQIEGMNAMAVVLFVVAVWLVYSGTAPLRGKST
jgi:hypothetical protein